MIFPKIVKNERLYCCFLFRSNPILGKILIFELMRLCPKLIVKFLQSNIPRKSRVFVFIFHISLGICGSYKFISFKLNVSQYAQSTLKQRFRNISKKYFSAFIFYTTSSMSMENKKIIISYYLVLLFCLFLVQVNLLFAIDCRGPITFSLFFFFCFLMVYALYLWLMCVGFICRGKNYC